MSSRNNNYFSIRALKRFGPLIIAISFSSTAFANGNLDNPETAGLQTISPQHQLKSGLTDFFKPNPSVSTRLNFDIWSDWLEGNVLFMGPSTRKWAPSAFRTRSTGSRLIPGHKSRFRHEGNKILYATMGNARKEFLKIYQAELEKLSEDVDITSLPRDQQLAYWFNLHNVAVINQIAKHYPIRTPENIEPVSGQASKLHDSKILKVRGQNLSLRDIREKIVYQHWTDSIVIYGFHHGTLGGPNIAFGAYEGERLHEVLEFNAIDYSNSMRGFSDGKISPIYLDASPFFFQNETETVKEHLKRFMRPQLFAELSEIENLKWHKPIRDIADLAGGKPRSSRAGISFLSTEGGITESNSLTPPYVMEFIRARHNNITSARKKGWLASGEVVITDIETIDPDLEIK